MSSADLLDLSATELSRRIAARELSCRELMQAWARHCYTKAQGADGDVRP